MGGKSWTIDNERAVCVWTPHLPLDVKYSSRIAFNVSLANLSYLLKSLLLPKTLAAFAVSDSE